MLLLRSLSQCIFMQFPFWLLLLLVFLGWLLFFFAFFLCGWGSRLFVRCVFYLLAFFCVLYQDDGVWNIIMVGRSPFLSQRTIYYTDLTMSEDTYKTIKLLCLLHFSFNNKKRCYVTFTSLLVVLFVILLNLVIKRRKKSKWQGEGIILLHFYLQQPQPRFIEKNSEQNNNAEKSVYRIL